MQKYNRCSDEGFTLVELLIVVAIIGIIAAVAIPNLLSAIQRGKQKRTMGDLKTLGSALEDYNTDANAYISAAAAAPAYIGDGAVGIPPLWSGGPTSLDPDYQRVPVFKDGWWSVQASTVGMFRYGTVGTPATEYVLCSQGKNSGTTDGTGAVPAGCGPAVPASGFIGLDGATFNCDIVMIGGQFNQQPSGKQKNTTGCI